MPFGGTEGRTRMIRMRRMRRIRTLIYLLQIRTIRIIRGIRVLFGFSADGGVKGLGRLGVGAYNCGVAGSAAVAAGVGRRLSGFPQDESRGIP